MGRAKKIRIGLIVLGLFIAVTGFYLQFVYQKHFFYFSTIFFLGAGIVRYGYRHNKQGQREKTINDKPKTTTQTTYSEGHATTIAGIAILLVSSGAGSVATLVHDSGVAVISLLFVLVGVIVILVGGALKIEEKISQK